MPAKRRWTTDEHQIVQMLRGLQDEISQLQGQKGVVEEVQLFRDIFDTARVTDSVTVTVYDDPNTLATWDTPTSPGWDFGESE